MAKKQGGFSFLIVLLAVVIVGLVGFVGWKVYNSAHTTKSTVTDTAQNTTQNNQSTQKQTTVTTPELKEFCSDVENACFKYPADWTFKTVSKYSNNNDNAATESVTATSPNGTVVEWDAPVQGLGGGCDLDSTNEISVDSIKTNPQDNSLQIVKIHSGPDTANNVKIGYFKPEGAIKPVAVGKTGDCIFYFTYSKYGNGKSFTVMFRTTSYNAKDEAATYQLFESLTYQ